MLQKKKYALSSAAVGAVAVGSFAVGAGSWRPGNWVTGDWQAWCAPDEWAQRQSEVA